MTASPADAHAPKPHHQSFWLWAMCLTGVDYFSTLGYQPSIAFEATGLLSPLATIVLVLVTLFGALPVYAYVAGQSSHGQGSIGMLERLVSGWTGKFLVIALLGFAATDFVITKTLSAADAAEHLVANPFWPFRGTQASLHRQQFLATMFLLVMLGATFLRGFREVIGLAVVIVGVYLLLNLIVVSSCMAYLARHPDLLSDWWGQLMAGPHHWYIDPTDLPLRGGGILVVIALCFLLFPKLALGLSGFETGVAIMPLIKGDPDDDPKTPGGRIRNTRKLLVTAAVIMSFFLITSSFAVSTLIPPDDLDLTPAEAAAGEKAPAKDRALAYLAHGESPHAISPLFGVVFGTIYDISTVVILWFAGASAMAALLNLVPQYLPRYGMAPEWSRAIRPLVILFTLVNLFVTWYFDASVTKQGGAYATGVLVLILSACLATVIQRWRTSTGPWYARTPWYFVVITLVFAYTTALNIYEKPDGIKIAGCFIGAIFVASIVSRAWRARELRFKGFQFKDPTSRFLWESMEHLEFPVLVPHRPGRRELADKEASIRREHRLGPEIPIVFLEVERGDPSDFYLEPVLEVIQEEGRFILRITRVASISHTIAALGLELSKVGRPPEIHFGWSDESPLAANLGFVLFGEGNVPWMVRELIRKAEENPERQPRVIVG